MEEQVTLKILKLDERARLPTKGTNYAACFDVYAFLPDETVYIPSFETKTIPLGLCFEVPEGYELQVRPRSGLALTSLFVGNSPGTVDADYRLSKSGEPLEVKVILYNGNPKLPFVVIDGMKIAQICLQKVVPTIIEETYMITPLSDNNRTGGFGSTGLQYISP